jgi:hypothetical protein
MKIEKQAHRSKIYEIFGAPKIKDFRGLFRKNVDQKLTFKIYIIN